MSSYKAISLFRQTTFINQKLKYCLENFPNDIWAVSWQNQQMTCAQQRLRSAWASPQSDQSSLCAQWLAKDASFLHADSEDSDQTGRMPRLTRVFAGLTCHFVGFVTRWLISLWLILFVSLFNLSKKIHVCLLQSILAFSVPTVYDTATSWENLFMQYANSKDTDQPAHPRSLISAFVVCCLDCIIAIVLITETSRL